VLRGKTVRLDRSSRMHDDAQFRVIKGYEKELGNEQDNSL
jgi:hypothetical protein